MPLVARLGAWDRKGGLHQFRHYYPSVMMAGAVSIEDLAEGLGYATPASLSAYTPIDAQQPPSGLPARRDHAHRCYWVLLYRRRPAASDHRPSADRVVTTGFVAARVGIRRKDGAMRGGAASVEASARLARP